MGPVEKTNKKAKDFSPWENFRARLSFGEEHATQKVIGKKSDNTQSSAKSGRNRPREDVRQKPLVTYPRIFFV